MSQGTELRKPFEIGELRNPLMKGLACAALSSGLRSLLVFNASPITLQKMTGLLAQMVAVITGGEVVSSQSLESKPEKGIVSVQLGTVETEEELWGSLSLGQDITARTVVWKPGLLAAGRERETRIVVIPDLSRLSLAASRACVMLMGSEVAHLERHGQHDRWQPQLYWVAGCDRTRIGTLSPHLLDRFALRLSGGEDSQNSAQRVAQLRMWFEQFDQKSSFEEMTVEPPSLSEELEDCLKQAQLCQPKILLEARARVLDYVELTDGYSTRRDLALLRLAKAITQLQGFVEVAEERVDEAAAMIGLSLHQQQPEMPLPDITESKPEMEDDTPQLDSSALNRDQSQATGEAPTSVKEEPVFKADTEETLPSTSLPMGNTLENPYLEDVVEPEQEAASLRLPPRRFKSASLGRGAIIGVEPATIPQDLALVSTLLEAAKYQKLRWKALQGKQDQSEWARRWLEKRAVNRHSPMILQSSDLRRYRRAVVPEQMLMLVMDYTCLRECQWQAALLPYLQWAYVERASLCLIQVGAASVAQELQAEKIVAQNVLVPKISNGLEVGGGQATPLAHGLDLALQTLRHALQHGRSAVRQAVLVVVSDGRGNVPLKASQMNQKPVEPVNRQGIEDALQVAQQIADLKQVEAVVLNPQPKYYADLPVKLAQALGAKIAAIPSLRDWEVDR